MYQLKSKENKDYFNIYSNSHDSVSEYQYDNKNSKYLLKKLDIPFSDKYNNISDNSKSENEIARKMVLDTFNSMAFNDNKIYTPTKKVEKEENNYSYTDSNESNEIDNKLTKNESNKTYFKTFIKTRPIYSCSSIHDNYVDCVQFYGNFILSKSVDGKIKEWMPIFNKEGDSYLLINTYKYQIDEKIWFIKFNYIKEKNCIFVGNEKGEVFLFHLKNENEINDNEYSSCDDIFNIHDSTIIRAIAYSQTDNICIIASNNGELLFCYMN